MALSFGAPLKVPAENIGENLRRMNARFQSRFHLAYQMNDG